MDRKFLKEHNLEEMRKRFQQICEYTFITAPTLSEDDEETAEEGKEEIEEMPPEEGPYNVDGNNNTTDSGEMGSEIPVNDKASATENDTPSEEGEETEVDTMESGDEVISVDDITRAQKETEYKVDGIDDKLVKLLNFVERFSDALERNDKKIDALRTELERRNPTEEERLNIRSQSSYPYCELPRDYWLKKKGTNYNVISNNEVSPNDEQEEYVLTRDDITTGNDREIARSMGVGSLSDYIKY